MLFLNPEQDDKFTFQLSGDTDTVTIHSHMKVCEGASVIVTFSCSCDQDVLNTLKLALEQFENECYSKLAKLRNSTPSDISYSLSSLEES